MSFVSQIPISSLQHADSLSILGAVALVVVLAGSAWLQRARLARLYKRARGWMRKGPITSGPSHEGSAIKASLQDLLQARAQLVGSDGFLQRRTPPASALFLGPLAQSLACLQDSSVNLPYRSHFDPESPTQDQPALHWAMNERFLGLCYAPESNRETHDQTWSSLLTGISRSRVLSGLRYVVLSLDLAQIAQGSSAERKRFAQTLGRRVQAMKRAVGHPLAVYLIVDGLEQLPGFTAFRRGITKSEWSQPCGFEGLADESPPFQLQEFAEQLRSFAHTLQDRVLQDMLEQADPALGSQHQHFALALHDLGPALQDLLRSLLSCATLRDPMHVAGVYFTSNATKRPCEPSSDSGPGEGLFVSELIPHMNRQFQVFQGTEPWAHKRTRRTRFRGLLRSTAFFASASSLWLMAFSSSRDNRAIQREFNELLREIPSYSSEPLPTQVWKQSAQFDDALSTLRQRNPWSHRWGMSQLPLLNKGSQRLFLRLTLQAGIAPLRAQDHAWLEHQVQQADPLSVDKLTQMQERLFRYLMLSATDAEHRSLRGAHAQERMVRSLERHWIEHNMVNDPEAARLIAKRFVALQDNNPELRFDADESLVEQVRARLLREDPIKRLVDDAIAGTSQARPRLHLDRILSPRLMHTQRRGVCAAFTQEGWEQTLRPRLEATLKDQNQLAWTLGGSREQIQERQQSQLRQVQGHYRQAFIVAWHELVDSIELHAQADLLELAHPKQSPFHQLAAALQKHTQLSPIEANGSESARWASSLRDSFAPILSFAPEPADPPSDPSSSVSHHQHYRRLLIELHELGPAPLGESPSYIRDQLRGLVRKSHQMAMEQRIDWRPWFARVLSAPFRVRWQSSQTQLDSATSSSWCALSQRLDREVFDRYPFSKHARQEVELPQLRQLLHPEQGELWRFVKDKLNGRVQREGTRFLPAQNLPPKRYPPRSLLRFLSAAWKLSQTLYPPGQDQLHLALSVQVQPQAGIHQTSLSLDEQRYHYVKGSPTSSILEWPSRATIPRSELQVRGTHGELRLKRSGTWSLLRILESGQTRRLPHSQAFLGSWSAPHSPDPVVTLIFRPLQGSPILFSTPQRGLLGLFRARALRRTPRLFRSLFTCT